MIAELVTGLPEVMAFSRYHMHICEVHPKHVGLLYVNQQFQTQLRPGVHAWWVFGRSFHIEVFDLRLQTLEVSGQDILSKDKVPLRLNLTAHYYISDVLQVKNLSDPSSYLYKKLQFALHAAVGERTLDTLLEDKGAIEKSIFDYIYNRIRYGITVESVGVTDIILPGEIRTILSKVVEAEKQLKQT